MKRAYSLNDRRTLTAERISYDDCIGDRIVCEICGNRVYKCVLGDGPEAVHYLSHYKAQSAIAAACSERVDARISGIDDRGSGTSRGQELRIRVRALGRILDGEDATRALIADDLRKACLPSARDHEEARIARTRRQQQFRRMAATDGIALDTPLGFDRASAHVLPQEVSRLEAVIRPKDPRPDPRNEDMTALIVLTESIPALNDLHDHSMASFAHGGSPYSTLLPSEASTARMNPNAASAYLDAGVVAEMRRLIRTIDYEAPVPPGREPSTAEERSRSRERRRESRRREGDKAVMKEKT